MKSEDEKTDDVIEILQLSTNVELVIIPNETDDNCEPGEMLPYPYRY